MQKVSRRQFLIVASAAVTVCPDTFDAVASVRGAVEDHYYLVDELGNHLTDENGYRLLAKTSVLDAPAGQRPGHPVARSAFGTTWGTKT